VNHCEVGSAVEKLGVDDCTFLVMFIMIKLSLFAAGFFVFLFWLYQPNIIENPGVAAYQPPPATRLVSLPRKMEAPEIIPSADSPVFASVDNDRPRDAIIKKNSTRDTKAKPRQKAVPFYWYAERRTERQRMSFREWNGNRRNYWF
jgi:hypothetical protein